MGSRIQRFLLLSHIVICFSSHISYAANESDALLQDTEARSFGDSIVRNIEQGTTHKLQAKMTNDFKEALTENQFNEQFQQIVRTYGHLIRYEHKKTVSGVKLFPDGKKKPMKKLWYSVTTTKHKKDDYYLFVEIVTEGSTLACSGFSFVTFPYGVPNELK